MRQVEPRPPLSSPIERRIKEAAAPNLHPVSSPTSAVPRRTRGPESRKHMDSAMSTVGSADIKVAGIKRDLVDV